jgi:putative MATE family efflux protein
MIFIGRLGEEAVSAIAGVGVAGTIVQLSMGAMMGLTMGMRALVARFVGAGDIPTANRAVQQAFTLSLILAVLMAVAGAFFSEELIALFGASPDVVREGGVYLRINFIGSAAMALRMMMDSVMQASGDSMNPMWIALVYRTLHIVLAPFLVLGWWIFPRLGVSGAAVTSVVSQTLGVVLGLGVLTGNRSTLRLSLRNFRFDFKLIWRIVRIGLPALAAGIQRMLSQTVLLWFMMPFGTIAVAAHSINQRIEMMLFMPAMAFGMGAGVLVGQNLGAKQPERAEKSVWLAVALVEVLAVVASVAMFIWSSGTIRIFNSNPALVTVASDYLQVALVGFIWVGFMFVLMNAIQSAGDTMPMMFISIITTWVITLPLAYLLPKWTDWGAFGVRWAMAISVTVAAIANVIYFRTGKWKHRRV